MQSFRFHVGRMCSIVAVIAAWTFAQDCSQPFGETIPNGAQRITANYVPSAQGWWWEIYNWKDRAGAADQLIDPLDDFNFRDSITGNYELPGPSVMRLAANGETWYYLTGTNGENSGLANFLIYRTKDFASFRLHMKAFSSADVLGVGQRTENGKLFLTNHGVPTWYYHVEKPNLYFDPTHSGDRRIYLSFTGAKESTDIYNRMSEYLVQMPQSAFLSWHGIPNPEYWYVDGPRFADKRIQLDFQQWYFYKVGGTEYYDGGYSVNHEVPTSGEPGELVGPNCGDLVQREMGFAHRWCEGGEEVEAHPQTWMERDGTVFFDPNKGNLDPWKRVIFYTWNDRNPSVPWAHWGNHIAAHPLRPNNIEFDETYATLPIADATNTNNPVSVNGLLRNNGSLNNGLGIRADGGIAEAPAVVYLPETDRYYVFYSRNSWYCSAYQIVYRMTEPGQPLSSLAINWQDPDVQEYVLLRNAVWNGTQWVGKNYMTGTPQRVSFGTPAVFWITSGSGATYPYLATGVKLDYNVDENGNPILNDQGQYAPTGLRTVFFKELTVESVNTGKLLELIFDPTNSAQIQAEPARDIRRFRIPYCRMQGS